MTDNTKSQIRKDFTQIVDKFAKKAEHIDLAAKYIDEDHMGLSFWILLHTKKKPTLESIFISYKVALSEIDTKNKARTFVRSKFNEAKQKFFEREFLND